MHRRYLLLLGALATLAAVPALLLRSPGERASRRSPPAAPSRLLLITIDTLRADRIGAYGYGPARTPALDGLARRGMRFDRAFAPAPITLPSHASILTGLNPPRHGSRHNGIRIAENVETLATRLKHEGFATGAFVGAFPLDRRFGLARGFDAYDDEMPRDRMGRPANEREGKVVVDAALRWLRDRLQSRWFVWVHLFEPHAPYGQASPGRPAAVRYDDEIAEADRQIARLIENLGALDDTLVIVAGDHGEAFGEHGEIGHSIFVYDTTLRVPLIVAGPGVPSGVIEAHVSLIDVAPTVMELLRLPPLTTDGISVAPALHGAAIPERELYAESYAPLFDFGWSGLRSIRSGRWKFIDAPRRELYDVTADPGEQTDRARERDRVADTMARVSSRYPAPDDRVRTGADVEAIRRLQALGYVGGTKDNARPDPKDRKELAAAIAQVTSGELSREEHKTALQRILSLDPKNPQAHMRLGILLVDEGQCGAAAPHLSAAIASGIPTADAHLAQALCATASGDAAQALTLLEGAARVEPDNPVVDANQGIILAQADRPAEAIAKLRRALVRDPDLHQARFTLVVTLADSGRRAEAREEVRALLQRLPPTAPQRKEVERLAAALQ